MKTLCILLAAACVVLAFALWRTNKERLRWRDSALGNARKRLRKNETHQREVVQINRRAAKEIYRLNTEIYRLNTELDALADENRRLRVVNENYRKQIERKGGGSDG